MCKQTMDNGRINAQTQKPQRRGLEIESRLVSCSSLVPEHMVGVLIIHDACRLVYFQRAY